MNFKLEMNCLGKNIWSYSSFLRISSFPELNSHNSIRLLLKCPLVCWHSVIKLRLFRLKSTYKQWDIWNTFETCWHANTFEKKANAFIPSLVVEDFSFWNMCAYVYRCICMSARESFCISSCFPLSTNCCWPMALCYGASYCVVASWRTPPWCPIGCDGECSVCTCKMWQLGFCMSGLVR